MTSDPFKSSQNLFVNLVLVLIPICMNLNAGYLVHVSVNSFDVLLSSNSTNASLIALTKQEM